MTSLKSEGGGHFVSRESAHREHTQGRGTRRGSVDDGACYGGQHEGEEAVAEHADALEERHAAAEQLGVHRHDCCPAPRDDEDGAEHEAAVVLRGERRVELVGRGALAREKDGQGEAQDEGAPQVPVLQLSPRLH
jgi:hypothetical protein